MLGNKIESKQIYSNRSILIMEFPPEIVQLIRDFSRPLFPHYKIYNEVLRFFGFKQWPILKEKIHEEKTQFLAKQYMSAYEEWRNHEYIMEQHYLQTNGPFIYEQFITRSKYLKQQLGRKQYREQQKYRDLSRHLYGEVRILIDLRRELSTKAVSTKE